MAVPNRNNRAARWAIALAGLLATAGFWTGIVTGPQPAQATPIQVAAAQPASPSNQNLSGSQRFSTSAPSVPRVSTAPRLRTRGS